MTGKLWQLVVVALCVNCIRADTVQFFYNHQFDVCAWGLNAIPASENTYRGGMCAYVESVDRVYACPAPDPTCWTFNRACAIDGKQPGNDQILCTKDDGYQWCCMNTETCTITADQVNVCVGQFQNLVKDVSVEDARTREYSAIPASAISSSSFTAAPSVVTSSTFFVATPGPNMSNGSSTSGGRHPSTTHLPAGAIAGIVVGAVLGLVVICGTIIYLVIHRRRQQWAKTRLGSQDGRSDGPSAGHKAARELPASTIYEKHSSTIYEKVTTVVHEAPNSIERPEPAKIVVHGPADDGSESSTVRSNQQLVQEKLP